MKRAWFVFLIYATLTIALTYPFILHLRSVIPTHVSDSALNTWILWWNAKTLPFTSNWWNAPIFYPASGALSLSENLLGLSLITTPLQWLNLGPQTAYNIVFLLTFPLSALGAYLLTYEVTQRRDAAFLAGLLFGFSPYRVAHLDHIQILASYSMPFALLGLHRSLRDLRFRWLALFAGSWLLVGLCNLYFLLFFSVFVGLWILWFASLWSRPRQFIAIGTAWLIAALLMLPLLLQYRHIHQTYGFARDIDTINGYAADVGALLQASRLLSVWGWLHVFHRPEGTLFPGLTVTLLILAGILFIRGNQSVPLTHWALACRVLLIAFAIMSAISVRVLLFGPLRLSLFGIRLLAVSNIIKPFTISFVLGAAWMLTNPRLRRSYATRSVLGFYALSAFVTWLLCLGPAPTLMGHPLPFRGPYALLMFLPGFNGVRVPARFWMVTTLCLAVVGAIIFDRLGARYASKRTLLAAILALGVLADTWVIAMPAAKPPQPFQAASCGAAGSTGAVLELPIKDVYSEIAAMYRQISHGRPLVNGYSGYYPPHYVVLRLGLSLRDPDMLTYLAALGVTDIVVDRELDAGGQWDEYVAGNANAHLICREGRQTLYRLTAIKTPSVPARGPSLPITRIRATVNPDGVSAMTDNDRRTQWRAGPQREHTEVEIDLGAVRTVGEIELSLGSFPEAFPRRSVIEASEDGESWREVWSGTSAGLAIAGSIEAPLDVPLRYRFPATPARKLRMRLTANDDIYHWLIAELKVRGP